MSFTQRTLLSSLLQSSLSVSVCEAASVHEVHLNMIIVELQPVINVSDKQWYFLWCHEQVCCVEFDRKDIDMNKLVATSLEGKFHVFDLRTQHPTKGFASVCEKVQWVTPGEVRQTGVWLRQMEKMSQIHYHYCCFNCRTVLTVFIAVSVWGVCVCVCLTFYNTAPKMTFAFGGK